MNVLQGCGSITHLLMQGCMICWDMLYRYMDIQTLFVAVVVAVAIAMIVITCIHISSTTIATTAAIVIIIITTMMVYQHIGVIAQ